MEAGLSSYYPHRESLTRLIEFGETGLSVNNSKRLSSSQLIRRSTKTKLPPLIKSSPTSPDSMLPLFLASHTDDGDNGELTRKQNLSENDYQVSLSNPMVRIKQLEKNLHFIKENHKLLLTCLHDQIEELRRKNRDLQFNLVINGLYSDKWDGASQKSDNFMSNELVKASLPYEVIQHLTKLEIEVKRLRLALGEALKMNASLRSRLSNAIPSPSSTTVLTVTSGHKGHGRSDRNEEKYRATRVSPSSQQSSPKFEDFCETWKVINSAKSSYEANQSFLPGIK